MTHFEHMELNGQTNIFEFLEPSAIMKASIQIGDPVKINIGYCDDEATNYFMYYYPHVINKAGTVIDSKPLRDKMLYLVDIYGETHWMYAAELVVL